MFLGDGALPAKAQSPLDLAFRPWSDDPRGLEVEWRVKGLEIYEGVRLCRAKCVVS